MLLQPPKMTNTGRTNALLDLISLFSLLYQVSKIIILEIKSFFKKYVVDYAITVVLIFPLCPPPPSTPHSLR